MARLEHLSLAWLYVALVAAGAVGGGAFAAVSCLVDWRNRRRT